MCCMIANKLKLALNCSMFSYRKKCTYVYRKICTYVLHVIVIFSLVCIILYAT